MNQSITFQYETESNSSFLVAVLPEEMGFVQYQMKMLENNRILHLLDARKYRENENIHICYNVTSRISLAQVLARQKMTKEEFLLLFSQLLECYDELPEYQLPTGGLMLQEDYVFVKPGSFEPSFVYLPVYTQNDLDAPRRFAQKMIMESRIATTNDDFIQRLLDILNDSNLTVKQLREKVEQLHRASGPRSYIRPEPVKAPIPPVFEPPKPAPAPAPAPTPEVPVQNIEKYGGKQKKQGKKKEKNKEQPSRGSSSKKTIVFAVIQIAAAAAIAGLAMSGFFLMENGALNVSYMAGILIAVTGLDFVLYRELFVNSKNGEKNAKKAAGGKGGKKGKQSTSVKREVVKEPVSMPENNPAPPQPEMPSGVSSRIPVMPVSSYGYSANHVMSGNDNDDTFVDENGAFGDCYLEYFENGLVKRIHLQEGVTRIGSRAQSVDYVLTSNRVSKIHAEFVYRSGRCFVRDMNSTNGTYLNGGKDRIVSNQEIEVRPGDMVRMANVELVLKC